jgi:aspartyl-tRNA(Asn)/glutamyl-tRNA(Gln) amidotransferase subunit A
VTILDAGRALRAKSVSVTELTETALKNIERQNPNLNAFLTVTADAAREHARCLDEDLAQGRDRGPLHGIPIAHKDIVDTKGIPTTAGTKILADRLPKEDAEIVTRLAEAGCISVGKTNLHECCYGITSNNPHYGAVRNPWDTDRIPGGSSGGSAAAVAAGLIFAATGTDTGGSIRIPASMCGVVGFKPTYDGVSRRGVGPLGFTLDHVGPLTRTVRDAALCFQAMSGQPAGRIGNLRGLRIGIPRKFFFDRVDVEVRTSVRHAAICAARSGAELIELPVPDIEAINAVGRLILLAETAAVWRRYLDRSEDFGADVLAGIRQGALISAADYLDAQRLRRVLAKEFEQVWQRVDFLLTPATPTTAPKIGEMNIEIDGVAEDVRLASTRLVRPFNVLGWPALVMPCGKSVAGLPIGLQLVAAADRDDDLLAAGEALEHSLGQLESPP